MNLINDIERIKLALALRQSEQALRNLRLAQRPARRQRQEHLDQGVQDLVHRLAQVAADIRTLLSVMDAQTFSADAEQWES